MRERLSDEEVARRKAEEETRLGRKICGARTRAGHVCLQSPLTGRARCRMHGGNTPVGPALPQFKTGRYSKYLNTDLREKYEAALADPDIMRLESEIALVESRLGDLISETSGTPAAEQWNRIDRLGRELRKALANGDSGAAFAITGELSETIAGAKADAYRWGEVYLLIDTRRKLVESHAKKEKDLGTMISAERAYTMIQSIVALLTEKIQDPRVLSEITAYIGARIVGTASERPK